MTQRPNCVQALEQLFAHIATTRMADVPVQNSALRIQALGFEPDPHAPGIWLGILITPWFMNLVRLAAGKETALLAERQKATRRFGNTEFDFIGAFEPTMGAFETCSLFSPMFEFANHSAALATATEILSRLRQPAERTAPAAPGRRSFLFGRAATPMGRPA